jgi:CSLREA domain-containing protein
MERSAETSQGAAPVRRRGVALILTSALAAALLAVPVAGAHAATVTKLADTDNECTPADCSLREAIDSGDHVIDFAPGLAGRIDLQSPLPDLAEDVEIRGPGADVLTVRRDGGNLPPYFRIFNVSGGVSAEISGLTIANGSPLSNCDTYGGCPPDPDFGNGGGIENSRNATLMIRDSVVAGNEALGDRWGGSGGGIANHGTLTLINSTVNGNQAAVGAGIANTGAMTIVGSTVSANGGGGFSGSSIDAGIR